MFFCKETERASPLRTMKHLAREISALQFLIYFYLFILAEATSDYEQIQ